MTNAAILTVVQNCPNFTHFRLYIMDPVYPEYLRNELMDEAFCAVAKNCSKLKRLQFSGLVTDMAFEYIGKYAKNLSTLSVGYAGGSDRGMQCVLRGCPFGNEALLSGLEKYETMRSDDVFSNFLVWYYFTLPNIDLCIVSFIVAGYIYKFVF